MRLGDLDALKEELKQYFSDGTLDSISAKLAFNMILRKIDEAPTLEIPNYGGQVVPDTLQGWRYEEKQQGEWIDYDNTFYKCPDCGYLLEKCCPQCQNKVILPKGSAE